MVESLEIGSPLRFGRWGGADIEWRVLDIEPNRVLLIADKAIDCKQYHYRYEDTTWSDCSLRSWLNGEFYQGAFNPSERAMILEARVVNDDNPEYGTDGGPDTRDHVFCLSIDEARIYFEDAKGRICHPSAYAKERGAWTSASGACDWWLRTPGGDAQSAIVIDSDGFPFLQGDGIAGGVDVDFETIIAIETGVRPALWICA